MPLTDESIRKKTLYSQLMSAASVQELPTTDDRLEMISAFAQMHAKSVKPQGLPLRTPTAGVTAHLGKLLN